jgi:hypothetical protein
MSMQAKLNALRNHQRTASGRKGCTVKLGDTGFTVKLEMIPPELTAASTIETAEKVGAKSSLKMEVDGINRVDNAVHMPGKEAAALMRDVFAVPEAFRDSATETVAAPSPGTDPTATVTVDAPAPRKGRTASA